MSGHLDRRSFLSAIAVGAGLSALAGRPAAALVLEENAPRERLYLSACESRNAHDLRIQEIVAQLESSAPAVSAEEHEKNLEQARAASCPICGCKLGAIEPYPTRF